MMRRSILRFVLPPAIGAALAVVYSSARADPPYHPPGAPSAAASASASAPAASGSAAAEPLSRPVYLPDFNQPLPPAEPSDAPSAADWLKAPTAPEVRVTDPGCTAKRLREWYRFECRGRHASLVAGEHKGVTVGYNEGDYTVWVIFPVRRGEVRVVLLARLSKWSIAPNALVSEQWLEGDPAPLLTLTGIPD